MKQICDLRAFRLCFRKSEFFVLERPRRKNSPQLFFQGGNWNKKKWSKSVICAHFDYVSGSRGVYIYVERENGKSKQKFNQNGENRRFSTLDAWNTAVLLIHRKRSPFSAGEGSFCLRLCLNESPSFCFFLRIRAFFRRKPENIVGRNAVIARQTDQTVDRDLPLSVFVLRVGVLLDVQKLGDRGLR